MAIALEIIPSSSSLHMYGVPDQSTKYSVSGHVNIILTPPSSYLERDQPSQLLLESLVITFEGQTEFLSEETGYTAVRLWTTSKDLVSAEPLDLTNDSLENMSDACAWRVVFNLTIPGWLPESSLFGERDGGISYALYASATIRSNDAAPSRTWLSSLCLPFQSQTRTLTAQPVPVPLIRYTTPSSYASTSTSPFPITHYEVSARPDDLNAKSRFPREVLSGIRVQMSVPACVSLEDEEIGFAIRLQANGLPESECKRLRVTDFWIDVEQSERYRARPLSAYLAQYPVPPVQAQPPQKPLLRPHPLHKVYSKGHTGAQDNVLSRSFSLLPPDAKGHYLIAGDGYIFTRNAETELDNTWFSLSAQVPVSTADAEAPADLSWRASRAARASSLSPLRSVSHRLYVTLHCTYDLGGGDHPERVAECLRFHVPLRFVRVPPSSRHASRSSSPASVVGHVRSASASSAETLVDFPEHPLQSPPYASALPAYSQLYYANGDRKIDYSIPLPLYTPRVQSEAQPLLSSG